jgi:F-type H+-transporting ATPase subunit b
MELISFLAEAGSVTAELAAVGENLKKQFGLHGQLLFSQVIGFLVFALLLKKFAFGPIQEMLDQRKTRIAEGEEKLKRIEKQLKREFGRLVAATTAQVTGKVLTSDDQQRINEETLAKVEA